MLPLNFETRGSLVVPNMVEVPLVFPGVRGKVKKAIDLPNGQSLPQDSLVIIQPLNLDKPEQEQRFKLTPYTPTGSSIDDLPENQRNISIDDANCCEVTLQNPSEYLEYGIEQYQQTKAPLFNDGSPSIEDINQGKIPDCFFLASLAAILSQPNGANYIRSMMRQNEDGTTTVRLFDPNTLEPTYVRVQNSYIVDKEGSLNRHTNLWVDILEKAASSVPEFFSKKNQSISDALQGGSESVALKIITGCSTKEKPIKHDKFFAWDIAHYFANELEQQKVWIDVIHDAQEDEKPVFKEQFKKVSREAILSKSKVFVELFGASEAEKKCMDLLIFYIDHKDEWGKIYNQYQNDQERLEQIINHFSQEEKNEHVINTLRELFNYYHKDVLKNVRRDNQTLFSGIYSPEELAVFNDVKDKLDRGEALAAGTPSHYDERVAGLRAMHAYTIVGVVEKNHPISVNGEDELRPIKMIRIRNPWGTTGRLYLPDEENSEQMKIVEARAAGTFDLELKDFCRYYESYSSTLQFSNVCILTEKREVLALKMQELLKKAAPSSQQDFQDSKLNQIVAYFECRDDLVSIQMGAMELLGKKIHEQIAEVFNDESKDPKAIEEELFQVINANKMMMMNVFQTADSELIAASMNYWWKNNNQKLTEEEESSYQNTLIDSVVDNNQLWKSLHTNYQFIASTTFKPLHDSYILANTLFQTIHQTQLELDELEPYEKGEKQILKALLLQKALLEQHLNYLENNEKLLQLHGINIADLRKKFNALDASIKQLDVFKENSDIDQEIEQEFILQNLPIDAFTDFAEEQLNHLVEGGLGFTKLHEGEDIPQHDDSEDQSSKLPQWVISLRSILARVFDAITSWRKSNTIQQDYNLSSSSAKYVEDNAKPDKISYVNLPTLFNKFKEDYKKATVLQDEQIVLDSGSSMTC